MVARGGTPAVRVLRVLLGETEVGTLTHLPGENTLFVFDEAYVADAGRPILSLSFKTRDGNVKAQPRPTRVRVPPFFSNLLPEGHLREYLARRGQVNAKREFFLLWLLGEDLPGAVRVLPADGEALPPEARAGTSQEALSSQPLRFSLAGMQLKFSAVTEATGGLTIPATGIGGSWIVKLPSVRFPSVPENEYVMLELARTVGIAVPDARLLTTGDVHGLPLELEPTDPALAVKRFDRAAAAQRIHSEDFAQVFALFPDDKYGKASCEDVARVIAAEAESAEVAEFARRLAFSALIGNGDMHLKNWSLLYRDGRTATLAPAYDFVSTVPYITHDSMALSLAGTKDWTRISLDLFSRFAARAGLSERLVLDAVRDVAARFMDAWQHHDVIHRLPSGIRKRITEHIRSVPLSEEV
jgi:serine/threonine-protein kinase HipA